jgi:hypothetical protein
MIKSKRMIYGHGKEEKCIQGVDRKAQRKETAVKM